MKGGVRTTMATSSGAQPAPAVGHDGEQRHHLGEEDEPDEPVRDPGHCPPRLTWVRLLDGDNWDDKQRSDEDGHLKPPLHPPTPRVHGA
jgi:hypothetical protein